MDVGRKTSAKIMHDNCIDINQFIFWPQLLSEDGGIWFPNHSLQIYVAIFYFIFPHAKKKRIHGQTKKNFTGYFLLKLSEDRWPFSARVSTKLDYLHINSLSFRWLITSYHFSFRRMFMCSNIFSNILNDCFYSI